jgi:hypothetical protein
MLAATFLAPFLIPMFFHVIHGKVFKPKAASRATSTGPAALDASGAGAAE